MAKIDLVAKFDDQPVNFERPPVNEVYLSLQSREKVFPGSDFGALVSVFGTQFPKLNAHPKLDRLQEPPPDTGIALQLEVIAELGQRFWLISEDETRVLQIQDDRVILNWRRRSEDEYPRYKQIRVEFEEALSKLTSALSIATDDLVDFCEVSYTNHIELPDGTDPRSQMHRVFRAIQRIELGVDHVALEEQALRTTLKIVDAKGEFQGRMRITTNPALLQKDRRPVLQTQLSFRGRPTDPTVRSALEFCDRGHHAIVTAFERMTTPEMHAFWGKK